MLKIDTINLLNNVNEFGIVDNIETCTDEIKNKTSGIADKVINLFSTIYNEIVYAPKAAIKSICASLFSENYATLNTAVSEKKSLIVFFHGLNGRPSVWNSHLAEFERVAKNNPEFSAEMYTPEVPFKGHCSLNDEEVIDLYNEIVKWCKNNPGKPVTLFGQSNGSRLALDLEVYLREMCPETPVLVSSTGGAIYGSSTVEFLTQFISPETLEKISFGLVTKVACEQLNYGSEASQNLLDQIRQPLELGVAKRKYQMIGALYDSHLLNPASSLPILNPGKDKNKIEKHYLVPGYGHNSIVNACTDKQVKTVFNWTSKLTDSNVRISGPDITLVKSNDHALVEVRDNRNILRKIVDAVKAAFGCVVALAIRMKRRFFKLLQNVPSTIPVLDPKTNTHVYSADQLPWSKDEASQGLFLTIHGLRASTTDWEKYQNDFKQQYPGAHYFNPNVALEGNCSLEEAAKPLLLAVEDYLRKFPGSSVTILGTSNGGRIAAYIESHLSPELLGESKLSVVSIAGVHNGTQFIDHLDNLGLLNFTDIDETLASEFHWDSEAAQKNLKLWQDKQRVWKNEGKKVSHLFIATTEDEMVRSLSASLPQEPPHSTNVKHVVCSGESHISVVDASHPKVMKWLGKQLQV